MPGRLLATLVLAAAAAGAGPSLQVPPGSGAEVDAMSFQIGQRRVLLLGGGLHYFRVPPEEWRDRLLQTRLAGFNLVETPVPWSLHEPARGTFRFAGEADLAGFLDLCAEQKLLVFLRIGPYVDAALANGGLPAWLGDDPKILVRSSNAPFIAAVRDYWAKLLPIVAARQAPRGPVVLVQVEDKYGGPQPAYVQQLYDEVLEQGVRLPIVLSALNPCKGFEQFSPSDRAFSATAELMPAGPLPWGEPCRAARRFDTILMEGIAKGIDGYDHAMWAGGTHFAVLPGSSFPTRFEDATTGLLEGGSPTEVSDAARVANFFAQGFEDLLTQSIAVQTHPFFEQARRGECVAFGRTDGKSTLVFFRRRFGKGKLTLADGASGQTAVLDVDSAGFMHVVLDYPVTPQATLASSSAQVFTVLRYPQKRVLVVHAAAGSRSDMAFKAPRQPKVLAGNDGLAWDPDRKQLVLAWSPRNKGERADFVFQADETVHIIALESDMLKDTWVLPGAGLLVGAPGVGAYTAGLELRFLPARQQYRMSYYPMGAERTVAPMPKVSGIAYDANAGRIDFTVTIDADKPVPAFLRAWEMAEMGGETLPGFDDKAWTESRQPLPMGDEPYGWYRCHFESFRAAQRKLTFESVADAATVYLNGQFVGQTPTKLLLDGPRAFASPVHFDVALSEGQNVLAVLVKNWGQYRNATTYGVPLAKATAWGIIGSVDLGERPLSLWRQQPGVSPKGRQLKWGPAGEGGGAVRWFRTTFRLRPHPARLVPRLLPKGMGHGAIWLNGRYAGLYHQRRYEVGRGYYLPPPWLRDDNEIILLEEEAGKHPDQAEVTFDREATLVPVVIQFQ